MHPKTCCKQCKRKTLTRNSPESLRWPAKIHCKRPPEVLAPIQLTVRPKNIPSKSPTFKLISFSICHQIYLSSNFQKSAHTNLPHLTVFDVAHTHTHTPCIPCAHVVISTPAARPRPSIDRSTGVCWMGCAVCDARVLFRRRRRRTRLSKYFY